MVARIRSIAFVLGSCVLFATAAALSGPQLVVGSDLATVVGADPDCETPGQTSNNCPKKPGAPMDCPPTVKYTTCKPKVAGQNTHLCNDGGNTCTSNTNCQETPQKTTQGKCTTN